MNIKKIIAAKLRGQLGESIAETLIALLISALALMMLAGAVSAAANVITKSRTSMNTYNTTTVETVVRAGWASAASDKLN